MKGASTRLHAIGMLKSKKKTHLWHTLHSMDKQYDHQHSQAHLRTLWEDERVYAPRNDGRPAYTIDTPPPTVSGTLHIGHIFSYTQTDIGARFCRMNGKDVFYPFGFDDNGLPTERFVEKQKGIVAHQLGRSAFIKVCLEETVAVEKQFQDLWQQLGLSVNWDACYSTIDDRSRAISQASFIELYHKKYVYRRDEPALYCPACRTSVAQAELDDAEKPSQMTQVAFASADGQELVIATTRPELLSSCVALLYHPADERYKKLAGTKAKSPLFGHEVPILADESVVPEKGTGLVMCCTFGDKTDIAWFKKFKFPYHQSIGRDGRMTERAGQFAGLKVKEARAKILEELAAANLIRGTQSLVHAVSVHERCKNEIEYLMLPQWFVSILPYKEEIKKVAEEIAWRPAFMKSRFINWVDNLSWDWCISRQRFYGIPFPAWHCSACNAIALAAPEQLPIDPQEVSYTVPCSCGASSWVADTDVMDTWNTSSLTPYICESLAKNSPARAIFQDRSAGFIPMSNRPQAHDIIRTWAFYTILKTWMHERKAPWREIVISGHVLATDGGKISKSQGNSPLDPQNLLATYPADVIRFWTASGMLGHDVAFSENQLKIGRRLVTKLWNAFLFIAEHTQDVDLAEQHEIHGAANQWILDRATATFEQYERALAVHELSHALDAAEKFFWAAWCDQYLELVKDQLFNPQAYDPALVASTRCVLAQVGLRILQWYAPFMPFVTDKIYQELYRQKYGETSLHRTQFSDVQLATSYPEARATMDLLVQVVDAVRKKKTERQLSLKTTIPELVIVASGEAADQLRTQEQLLKGVTRAEQVCYVRELPAVGEWIVECGA